MYHLFLVGTLLLLVLHIGFHQWFIPRQAREQDTWITMGLDVLLLVMLLWTFDRWLTGFLGEDPGYWSLLIVVGVVALNWMLKSIRSKNEPSH
jgi:hypothetical protein